jgi:hypothetical protein
VWVTLDGSFLPRGLATAQCRSPFYFQSPPASPVGPEDSARQPRRLRSCHRQFRYAHEYGYREARALSIFARSLRQPNFQALGPADAFAFVFSGDKIVFPFWNVWIGDLS